MGSFSLLHWLVVLMILLLFVPLYLLPYFVARRRRVATRGFLLLVNILIGWTAVGWVISLIWAIFGETEAQRRYLERHGGASEIGHADFPQGEKDLSARREPRL